MATAPNTPGNTPEVMDDGVKSIENIQYTYEQNKKRINTVIIVILLIIGGYLAYTQLYVGSNEKKAAKAMIYAEQYFNSDSLSKALEGDGQHKGLKFIAKNYGSTPTGNLAHYYAGICELKLGNFKEAISQLESFDGKGTVVENIKFGALGDAYMETGDITKGIDCYKKASADKDDFAITPLYLFRLGVAYEMDNKPKDAIEVYKRIKSEFPSSPQAQDMDKYLAKLGVI